MIALQASQSPFMAATETGRSGPTPHLAANCRMVWADRSCAVAVLSGCRTVLPVTVGAWDTESYDCCLNATQ